MVERPEMSVAIAPFSAPNQVKAKPNDHPSLLDPLLQGGDECQKLAAFIEFLFNYLGKCFGVIFEY